MDTEMIIWGWPIVGGLIGAAIGQSKNRIAGGLILGLLLGPIGWLLVAVGPNNNPKCTACKGTVEKGATKCKNCGTDLSAV